MSLLDLIEVRLMTKTTMTTLSVAIWRLYRPIKTARIGRSPQTRRRTPERMADTVVGVVGWTLDVWRLHSDRATASEDTNCWQLQEMTVNGDKVERFMFGGRLTGGTKRRRLEDTNISKWIVPLNGKQLENVNNNKSINVLWHQWNETEKLSSTAMEGRFKLILRMNY